MINLRRACSSYELEVQNLSQLEVDGRFFNSMLAESSKYIFRPLLTGAFDRVKTRLQDSINKFFIELSITAALCSLGPGCQRWRHFVKLRL